MPDTYFVRFHEMERYDVISDSEVLSLMATTPIGSYCAEVPNAAGAKNRERRQAFKEYVLSCMASGIAPHEVTLG